MQTKPKAPRLTNCVTAVATYAGNLDSLDQRSLAGWAADCAERVLARFEERCPNDERPRKAVEAARAWARRDIRCGQARKAAVAAHAAARACDHPVAKAAARATGHAAATAHMPAHARGAAAYAILAVMFDDPEASKAEHDWQARQLRFRRSLHGYHDCAAIAQDLKEGGFGKAPECTTLAARSRADPARVPALAYCQGTPLRGEIETRDPARLDEATHITIAALTKRFGAGPVDGKIRAHIDTAE